MSSTPQSERVVEGLIDRILQLDQLIEDKEANDSVSENRGQRSDMSGNGQGEGVHLNVSDEAVVEVHDDRFGTETNTKQFVADQKNQNTSRKTTGDVALIQKYFASVNEHRKPEDIPPEQLNTLLARYFINVKKANKNEYEPDTLKTHQASFKRYLKENGYAVDILQDSRFQHSRDVLMSKRKELKSKGKGNRPNKAQELTNEEVDLLFDAGQLGTGSPNALINFVWWNNTLHFGLRSRQEHLDMRWGDVELRNLTTGEEYLQYSERATKTRTGATTNQSRPFLPKMFAVPGSSRCPVNAYKTYYRYRPDAWKTDPDSPFYIAPNPKFEVLQGHCSLFIREKMGKNKLGNLLKAMCGKANIQGQKSNHSARKTTVTTLLHSDIDPTQIMQVTGHKNVQSINSYSSASIKQQMQMSNILSNVTCRPEGKENIENGKTDTVGNSNAGVTSNVTLSNNDVFNDDNVDDELLAASQEIENALQEIQSYETLCEIPVHVPSKPSIVELPIKLSKNSTESSNSNSSVLCNSNIKGNITINMYGFHSPPQEHTRKRKRIIVSDDDSD